MQQLGTLQSLGPVPEPYCYDRRKDQRYKENSDHCCYQQGGCHRVLATNGGGANAPLVHAGPMSKSEHCKAPLANSLMDSSIAVCIQKKRQTTVVLMYNVVVTHGWAISAICQTLCVAMLKA